MLRDDIGAHRCFAGVCAWRGFQEEYIGTIWECVRGLSCKVSGLDRKSEGLHRDGLKPKP